MATQVWQAIDGSTWNTELAAKGQDQKAGYIKLASLCDEVKKLEDQRLNEELARTKAEKAFEDSAKAADKKLKEIADKLVELERRIAAAKSALGIPANPLTTTEPKLLGS